MIRDLNLVIFHVSVFATILHVVLQRSVCSFNEKSLMKKSIISKNFKIKFMFWLSRKHKYFIMTSLIKTLEGIASIMRSIRGRLNPISGDKTKKFNYPSSGARPPPLIRRSSFPIPQAKQAATSSLCGTPSKGLTRRQSAESDEEIRIVTNALHHRTRLIRRH